MIRYVWHEPFLPAADATFTYTREPFCSRGMVPIIAVNSCQYQISLPGQSMVLAIAVSA